MFKNNSIYNKKTTGHEAVEAVRGILRGDQNKGLQCFSVFNPRDIKLALVESTFTTQIMRLLYIYGCLRGVNISVKSLRFTKSFPTPTPPTKT